jgi:hypothetical protein
VVEGLRGWILRIRAPTTQEETEGCGGGRGQTICPIDQLPFASIFEEKDFQIVCTDYFFSMYTISMG